MGMTVHVKQILQPDRNPLLRKLHIWGTVAVVAAVIAIVEVVIIVIMLVEWAHPGG